MKQNLVRQFLSFLGVGALATAVHYAVLLALVELMGVAPVPASALGAFTGAVVSYFLNRAYTFRSQATHTKAMPKFFAVALLAVMVNTALMWLFTTRFFMPYLLAQMLTTCILIVITFGCNKFWSFKA